MKNKKDDRRNESVALKDVIREMLQTYKIDKKYDANHLISSWEKLMGKAIASRTTRLFVKDNVLFVRLSSAPLKKEMAANKDKVLAIISKKFGDLIRDVVFQ